MYDVLTRSTLFGLRNADKVINTNDKGRIFADIGQFTNAATAISRLDNAVGKGAQSAINAMNHIAKDSKILTAAGKGATWASQNVNPLLIGAAGYRVLIADDKESALKREILGMSSMFGVEALVKEGFKSNTFQNAKRTICKTPTQKAICSILEGILFVGASIAASTTGYKIGKKLYPDKTKENTTNKFSLKELCLNEENTTTQDLSSIDESEYFLTKNNKAIA